MTEILKFCDSKGTVGERGIATSLESSHSPGLTVACQARTWLGTPFRHQGRVKWRGCDCLGLLVGVAAELGLPQFRADEIEYGHYPDSKYLQKRLAEVLEPVEEVQIGNIGLFSIDGSPQHLGFFGNYAAGGFSLIHAHAPSRRVVEHRFSAEWQEKLFKIFALQGG